MPECGEIKQCCDCSENEKAEISDECAGCVKGSNWREKDV